MRFLNEVGPQEGRLPLLQFALGDLGKARGGSAQAEAYTEVGGVAGAIEKNGAARHNS